MEKKRRRIGVRRRDDMRRARERMSYSFIVSEWTGRNRAEGDGGQIFCGGREEGRME